VLAQPLAQAQRLQALGLVLALLLPFLHMLLVMQLLIRLKLKAMTRIS
jgi:hypothetical protein